MQQNNDSLHQEINGLRQEMLEDHNCLFNQISELVEEKIAKPLRAIAEDYRKMSEQLKN